MLKIHLLNTRRDDGLLREDLTHITTDAADLKQYHGELMRLCKENSGVGISANQVGLRENFFFLMSGAKIPTSSVGKHTAHVCANPAWQPAAKSRLASGQEGCLSIPGRIFEVERQTSIHAQWTNVLGQRVQKNLKGWAARVFQHEYDHLRGVTLMESGKEVK